MEALEESKENLLENRRQVLLDELASELAGGSRLIFRSDFTAVLVKGKPVNHALHAILSVLTGGLWLIVWVILLATGGEKWTELSVDEDGIAKHSDI